MNRLAFVFAFWLAATGVGEGADWPTLRGNLQRTGFYPEFPNGKLRLAWRKELFRELTGPRAEVFVGGRRANLFPDRLPSHCLKVQR